MMSRLIFTLILAVYSFSAMDLHEWVHVPHVVLHMLEHHSDLGHHDENGSDHDANDDHDHTPFNKDCHGEFCAGNGMVALSPPSPGQLLSVEPLTVAVGTAMFSMPLSAFSGKVWNPPKLG
jgi:hypothetical protein